MTQARDSHGRFASGGGGSRSKKPYSKPTTESLSERMGRSSYSDSMKVRNAAKNLRKSAAGTQSKPKKPKTSRPIPSTGDISRSIQEVKNSATARALSSWKSARSRNSRSR